MDNKISYNELKKIIHYDPVNGVFTWLVDRRSRKLKGELAGTVNKTGYRVIIINKKSYKASRLAFLYMTENWPQKTVDHINRDKLDDRWKNLRDVSSSENNFNRNNPGGKISRRKYDDEMINNLKTDIKNNLTIKELRIKYPQLTHNYIWLIKNNKIRK